MSCANWFRLVFLSTSKGDSITLGGIWPAVECVCVVGASSSEVLSVGRQANTYTEWVLIVRREKGGHRCSVSQQKQLLQW